MKSKIITDAEIKALLGISSSSKDALVNMYNQICTDTLCELLDVSDLVTHAVTDERNNTVDPYGEIVLARDFPVDDSQTITIKDMSKITVTARTYDVDEGDRRTIRIYDSSGNLPSGIGFRDLYLSYTAGYTVQGTLTVDTFADLQTKTMIVNVAGTETTWTFVASGATGNQINAETSDTVTATNIATALSGSSALGVVTLPMGTKVTLGTALAANLAIVNATIPDQLKLCVALMVGGGIAQNQKQGGVSNYTLGSKSVAFRDKSDYGS